MFGGAMLKQFAPMVRAAITPALLKLSREGSHSPTPARLELLAMARELTTSPTTTATDIAPLAPLLADTLAAIPDSACNAFARAIVRAGQRLEDAGVTT